ncbi:MAG: prolyl-tRNA synthetase associated domain-containing protein [Alphaproteobacteria bacterium]|nr:prolyl-tRNA synthetase associated domain-containing protein [Alphaproteobacteria bacterium]
MVHQKLLKSFEDFGIAYELHTHEPLFTVGDALRVQSDLKGAHSKNLFLKDRDKKYFLVSVLNSKRVNLKSLSKNYAKGHFSFGSPDELKDKLDVISGAVTPYGLINNKAFDVTFLLDKDMRNYEFVNFHPLRNDMTVSVPLNDFLIFFEKIGHNPHVIEVPILVDDSAH